MATLASLVVKIVGDTGQLVASLETAERRTKRFAGNLSSVGGALTKLTAPFAALGVGAAAAAIKWEDAFAGVRKTVDATDAELAQLEAGFRGMAKTIPVSAVELAKIGEAAGQLGIHKESILGFTRTIADLAATTNLSSDQAATAFAQIANITGMPQDQFDRLGSVVVELGNKMATTEAQIAEYGLRIAGAGKLAGLTEPQMLAIGAAMASVGVEAEAGGTSLQKVLLDMTQAVAQGGEQLGVFAETAGMTGLEFRQAFTQDAAGAFASFVEGLGRQGDGAFKTMEKLDLTDQRVMRGFLSLANAGDLLRGAVDMGSRAWEDNTALTTEAEKRYGTTASQLAILWNGVKDTAISFGNALLPALRSVLTALGPVIDKVGALGEKFAALPQGVQTAVVSIGAVAAVIGPALLLTGALINSIGAIAPVAGAVGAAIGGMVAAIAAFFGLPVIVVVAGIVAAIVALVAAIVLVWKNWDTIGPKLMAIWQAIADFLGPLWSALVETARVLFDRLAQGVVFVFSWLKGWWETWGGVVTAVLGAIWSMIANTVKLALDVIKDIILFVLAVLRGDWGAAWDAIKDIVEAAGRFIIASITAFVTFVQGLWEGLVQAAGRIWPVLVTVMKGVWDGVVAVAKTGVNDVIGLLNALIRGYNRFNSISIAGVKIGLPDIPEIPKLAMGAQDFGGGMALVGERGPELVNLPRGSDVIPNHRLGQAAGQTIVVNVSGNTIFGEMDMRRVIVEAVRDHALAGGFHAVPGFSGA